MEAPLKRRQSVAGGPLVSAKSLGGRVLPVARSTKSLGTDGNK